MINFYIATEKYWKFFVFIGLVLALGCFFYRFFTSTYYTSNLLAYMKVIIFKMLTNDRNPTLQTSAYTIITSHTRR